LWRAFPDLPGEGLIVILRALIVIVLTGAAVLYVVNAAAY
jgi:hypothetical protein